MENQSYRAISRCIRRGREMVLRLRGGSSEGPGQTVRVDRWPINRRYHNRLVDALDATRFGSPIGRVGSWGGSGGPGEDR